MTNPNFPSQTTVDWGYPTVVASVMGSLLPVSDAGLERVGRVGAVNVFEVFMEPVRVTSAQRLRVGARVFRVLAARLWPSHTMATVEEVSDAGSGS